MIARTRLDYPVRADAQPELANRKELAARRTPLTHC
jgi:hypothetical protein